MASATACRDAAMIVDSDAGELTLTAVSVMIALVIASTLLGVSARFASVPEAASVFVAYSVRPGFAAVAIGKATLPEKSLPSSCWTSTSRVRVVVV